MRDDVLRAKLSEALKEDQVLTTYEEVVSDESQKLDECINNVMKAYQDANKWLDILKEELLMTHNCIFFSDYVHELAHTMPERFDRFGDILHTADIKIPYPATEYIPSIPEDIDGIFNSILSILDSICGSLLGFIKSANSEEKYYVLASATEELLQDISDEKVHIYRMRRAYNQSKDCAQFDKWVCDYLDTMDQRID